MVEKQVDVKTPDGVADCWLYLPDEEGQWPGVIYYTDIGAPRPISMEMANRLASEGYAVLHVNHFYRNGRVPILGRTFTFKDQEGLGVMRGHMQNFTPEQATSDAGAFVDWLVSQPFVKGRKVGVVGYCMTGAVAMRAAAARPDQVAALASFHGAGLAQDSLLALIPKIKAQMYFGHGQEDQFMPEEAIKKLEAALKAAGKKFESEMLPGKHGCTMQDHPVFNSTALQRHWVRLLGTFKNALQDPLAEQR